MDTLKEIVVIYHGNCYDGFAGAWVANKFFGDRASYLAKTHADKKLFSELKDKEIYFIDFCYKKEEMLELEKIAKKLVVIDHHISSREDIYSLKEYVFALDKSGCLLAWEFFFKNQIVPLLVQYISDRDTGARKIENTNEITAYIYKDEMKGVTFESFDELEKELLSKGGFERILETGKEIVDSNNKQINYYASLAEKVLFEEFEVYFVVAPKEIRSELGYLLASKNGKFGMVFFFENGLWKCSLRSANGFDVSQIAVKYGGGGHQKESCFTVTKDFPIKFNSVHKRIFSFFRSFSRVRV